MIRLRAPRSEADEARVDLAPLIDVVFLLLIFYVLAATFVTPTALPISRPSSSQAQALPSRPALVAITADGAVWINDQPWNLDDHAALSRELDERSEGRVLIHADGQVSTQRLVEVMDACVHAGARAIDLAADQGRRGSR
ncbi:MAG: biopolymer transporter ExbD [Planctomycetota bacterium]|nr:MAG: biopolymer transporter ExbD [Planctomycetota bacterium]